MRLWLSSDLFRSKEMRSWDFWDCKPDQSKMKFTEFKLFTMTICNSWKKLNLRTRYWNRKLMFWNKNSTNLKALQDKEMLIQRLNSQFVKNDLPIMNWLRKNWIQPLWTLQTVMKQMKSQVLWLTQSLLLQLPLSVESNKVFCLPTVFKLSKKNWSKL